MRGDALVAVTQRIPLHSVIPSEAQSFANRRLCGVEEPRLSTNVKARDVKASVDEMRVSL